MTQTTALTLKQHGSTTLDHQGDELEFLTFELSGELYGIDILKVQEIRGWSSPTQIPNAPHFIRGVTNLRGEIVPIVDLRRRFNMADTEFTPFTVVIVLNVQHRTIGIVVDAVSDVVHLQAADIRPAPDFGTAIDATFLHGLAPHNDQMLILLQADSMLQACELMELDKLADTSATA